MSSLAKQFSDDLVGFFSYSREDDEGFDDALSNFRKAIQRDLSAQLGRKKENFRIWQDRYAIPHGAPWRKEIADAIDQAVFFIPIVTPRAVESPFCAYEFETFLAREKQLGRGDLIFPILYIPVPELDDGSWKEHPVLKIVKERQYLDWCDYRPRKLSDDEIQTKLIHFCRNIASAMRLPWQRPQQPLQQPHEEAREAAEKAAQPQAPEPKAPEPKAPVVLVSDAAKVADVATAAAVATAAVAQPAEPVKRKAKKQSRGRNGRRRDAERPAAAESEQRANAAFAAGLAAKAIQDNAEASGAVPPITAYAGSASATPKPRPRSALMVGSALAAILLVGVLVTYKTIGLPTWLGGPSASAGKSGSPTIVAAVPQNPETAPAGGSPPTSAPSAPGNPSKSATSPVAPSSVSATSCRPGNTRVADATGGEPQPAATLKLTAKPRELRSIAVSPDGDRIVSAGDDGVIRVWSAANLKWLHDIRGHAGPVYSVAFSPDGSLLASASLDGTVRVWNAGTYTLKQTFKASNDNQPVQQYGVEFAPGKSPRYIDSAGQDGSVWIWDLQNPEHVRKWNDTTSPVRSLSFAPKDTGALVTASFDGKLRFFTESQKIFALSAGSGKLLHVAYSPNGKIVASAGVDNSKEILKLWDAASRTFHSSYTGLHDGANSLAWSRDGAYVAVGEGASKKEAPTVDMWDLQSGARTLFSGHMEDVEAVAFHPNRKWLLSGSEDGTMKVWNMADAKELLTVAGFANGQYIAYAPNGCYTGSKDAPNFVTYMTRGPDAHDTHDNGKNAMFVPDDSTEVLLPR